MVLSFRHRNHKYHSRKDQRNKGSQAARRGRRIRRWHCWCRCRWRPHNTFAFSFYHRRKYGTKCWIDITLQTSLLQCFAGNFRLTRKLEGASEEGDRLALSTNVAWFKTLIGWSGNGTNGGGICCHGDDHNKGHKAQQSKHGGAAYEYVLFSACIRSSK